MDLKKILTQHKVWLTSNTKGVKADLRGANLSWADLSKADLRGAYLSGTALSGVIGLSWACCGWSNHGERGRVLTCVEINGDTRFFCGCFQGSEEALRRYICKSKEELKLTRTMAMNFCLACMANNNRKEK